MSVHAVGVSFRFITFLIVKFLKHAAACGCPERVSVNDSYTHRNQLVAVAAASELGTTAGKMEQPAYNLGLSEGSIPSVPTIFV